MKCISTRSLIVSKDCEAYRLSGNDQGWQIVGSMEAKGRPGMGNAREESALNMFRQMDLKGKAKDDTQLKTVHQNTISTIRIYEGSGGAVKRFSSKSYYFDHGEPEIRLTHRPASGVDGRVVIWSA